MNEFPSNQDRHNIVKMDELLTVLNILNLYNIIIMWLIDEKKYFFWDPTLQKGISKKKLFSFVVN